MKKSLQISLWVCILAGMCLLLGFVNSSRRSMAFKEMNIHVDTSEGMFFLNEKDVKAFINDKGEGVVGRPVSSVDLRQLEKDLMNLPPVKNAQVYRKINGELTVNIQQRRPVLRLIDARGNSCYIDEEGKLMPLSPNFTPRVLVATGEFSIADDLAGADTNRFRQGVHELAEFVRAHEFWQAQVQQVVLKANREVELIPRVGDHRIMFGELEDFSGKFSKLFTLYEKGLQKTGWNFHDTIDLRYEDQVVCKKR